MTDTAQLSGAAETDPNAQLETAADAFKTFLNPASTQPRDETGKFASDRQPDETADEETELEAVEVEGEESDEDDEADEEAAEQAQPLPPSWPADKADVWEALPAPAKALIAERDAEQLRATNAKFQESANVRKAAELAAKEAQTKRTEYLQALETVESIYTVPKPDPRAFGYGTPQYNAAAYATAHAEYEQNERALAQVRDQRDAIKKQAATDEAEAYKEWRTEHEAQFAPKLLADVPDLKDQAKFEPLLRDLVTYAIEHGIPEDVFAEEAQEQITSAQLHLLWKAQQFDKLRTTKTAPKQRPSASPAVRPGVSSPRSAQKAARQQKSYDRLAREGTVEAGAEVFKQLFKG
jgi:hypothetical protein